MIRLCNRKRKVQGKIDNLEKSVAQKQKVIDGVRLPLETTLDILVDMLPGLLYSVEDIGGLTGGVSSTSGGGGGGRLVCEIGGPSGVLGAHAAYKKAQRARLR